ncbi:MAG TPA: LysR family transcriptional regulator [Acidobacteriota bacterium]|nr:LysR family transcriptional regulator [Acidobacteriota bacterium]
MLDLEVRHLLLVDAISKEGGVTKAAHRLNLTQSAVSHQLKEIEDRLGCPLFLRVNRKMVLTEGGHKILACAERILPELQRTEDSIRRMSKGQEGILRISTQCNTLYHWLPGMLGLFARSYPGIDVQINVEATGRPFAALMEGKLDLAIAYSKERDKNLAYFPLFQDELVVVMPPDHRLANQPYVRAMDFSEETLIMYSVELEESYIYQKVLVPAGVQPKKLYKVMLTEAIIEMVKAGIGISVLAKWAVAPYLKTNELKGLRFTKHGVHRNWHAVTLKNQVNPPYYLEFARLLAQNPIPAAKDKRAKIAI